MARGVPLLSIVLASCGGFHGPIAESAAIAGVLEPRRSVDADELPRIVTDGSAITAWTLPITFGALPARVRRVAEFVQPGGEIVFIGRVFEGAAGREGGDRYVIESRYDGAPWFRRLELDVEGAVALRSHGIELDAAPSAVRERMRAFGAGPHLEFVQTDDTARYRGSSRADPRSIRYLELEPDGTRPREWCVCAARVRG